MNESWLPSSWFECNNDIPEKLQIIGNLPFAVATPLTLNLFKEFSLNQLGLFGKFRESEMIFMFQNEVAKVPSLIKKISLISTFRNLARKLEPKIMEDWQLWLNHFAKSLTNSR